MRTQTAQLRLLVAEATAWSRGNMGSAANSDGGGAACRKTEADWCEADWPGRATGWSATWHKWERSAQTPLGESGRRDSLRGRHHAQSSAVDSESHRCRRGTWHWAIRLRKGACSGQPTRCSLGCGQDGVALFFFPASQIETRQLQRRQLEHVVRLALTCGYFREGLFVQLSDAKEEIGGGRCRAHQGMLSSHPGEWSCTGLT